MSTVDISLLQETAIKYAKDLKTLAFAVMAPRLGAMGISVIEDIQNKDVLTNFERKAGIAKPYVAGTVENAEVGKAVESVLEVFLAYANVKDNIQNYKKVAVGPDVLLGKNKGKKHPWQMIMLTSIIKTFGEDILFNSLFHATRDEADRSPLGIFNGYHTVLDNLITAEKIAVAQGNYDTSIGAITAPTDEADHDAADQILGFYRKSNRFLKDRPSILLMSHELADIYDDAYRNMTRFKPEYDEYGRTVLHGSQKKCTIVRSSEIGDGQRMILTTPGNLQFGMDKMNDANFVQVRDREEDPNVVQFWIQSQYGTRIRSFNKKELFINNQSEGSVNALSGDYIS